MLRAPSPPLLPKMKCSVKGKSYIYNILHDLHTYIHIHTYIYKPIILTKFSMYIHTYIHTYIYYFSDYTCINECMQHVVCNMYVCMDMCTTVLLRIYYYCGMWLRLPSEQ